MQLKLFSTEREKMMAKYRLKLSALWLLLVFVFYFYLNPWPFAYLTTAFTAMFFLFLAALGSGLKILSKLKLKTDTFLENISLCLGLGLGVLYVLSLFLGLCGLYGGIYPYAALVLLILVSCGELYSWFRNTARKLKKHSTNRFSFIGALFLIIISIAVGFALMVSLSPPVGEYALSGPLAQAGRYLQEGSVFAIPYNYQSHLPPGMSLLQVLALLTVSESGARMISFLFLFLLVAGVYSMTRKFFHRKIALFAVAVTVSTPALINFYSADHPFMASLTFGFLAVYCFICWASDSSSLEGTSRKWIIICGIFSGLSLSFGFYSMFAPLALIIMIIYSLIAIKKEISFQRAVNYAAWFLIPFIAVLVPMGIKNMIVSGNPFFPFFSSASLPYGISGGRQSLWGYLTPLWNIPFINRSRPGNFFLMGPLYLLFLPAVLAVREVGRTMRILIGFVGVYFVIYIIAGREIAYIYFLIPVLSIITAYIIVNLYGQKKYFYQFVMAVFFAGILLNFHLILEHTRGSGSIYFTMGLESKDQYLRKRVPGYEIFEYINEKLDPESKVLLGGESRTFYIERKVIASGGFTEEAVLDMLVAGGNAEGFLREMKMHNVTHLLIKDGFNRYWNEINRLIFKTAVNKKMKLLFEQKDYILYELL